MWARYGDEGTEICGITNTSMITIPLKDAVVWTGGRTAFQVQN